MEFKENGRFRQVPAGAKVRFLVETEVGSGNFAVVGEGKTDERGQVTFKYRVPPKKVPGVYLIRIEYHGGARFQPSTSRPVNMTVRSH